MDCSGKGDRPVPGEKAQSLRAGTRGLKVLFTNARSVNKKINELKTIACDLEPEVIAITETGLIKL